MDYFIVLVTTSSNDEAERIAHELIERRLAACINIINGITSIYVWKGNVEKSTEALMIIKTRSDKLDELISNVRELHSYEVPEIVAIPIVKGFKEYIKWIDDVLEGRET